MVKYAILQDLSLCMECQGCRVACQMQNQLQSDEVFVKFRYKETGTYPQVNHHISRFSCLHCEKAACVMHCPTGAVYKGDSGLTHFQAGVCSGCGNCEDECPFAIPVLRGSRVLRCTGCEALTENGKPPACVSTCMAGALAFGPREELLKKAEKRAAALRKQFPGAQVYSPDGVGGTNLIWVLRDAPEVYDLLANPWVATRVNPWQEAARPGSRVAAAAAAVAGLFGWLINRRNLLQQTNKQEGA